MERHFVVRTDQRSLKFLLEQHLVSVDHQKWLTKLMGYHLYSISPGLENKAADALSRVQPAINYLAIRTHKILQLDEIRKEVEADEVLGRVVKDLQKGLTVREWYALVDNTLCYRGKVVLPSHSPFVALMLRECHDAKVGGHFRVLKTYKCVAREVF